jgi:hypothetical protein
MCEIVTQLIEAWWNWKKEFSHLKLSYSGIVFEPIFKFAQGLLRYTMLKSYSMSYWLGTSQVCASGITIHRKLQVVSLYIFLHLRFRAETMAYIQFFNTKFFFSESWIVLDFLWNLRLLWDRLRCVKKFCDIVNGTNILARGWSNSHTGNVDVANVPIVIHATLLPSRYWSVAVVAGCIFWFACVL